LDSLPDDEQGLKNILKATQAEIMKHYMLFFQENDEGNNVKSQLVIDPGN
jgi:hypothetical protein